MVSIVNIVLSKLLVVWEFESIDDKHPSWLVILTSYSGLGVGKYL